MAAIQLENAIVDVSPEKISAWFAWNDLMLPGPPSFHVVGDIEVPNPGVDAFLHERVPQGINPRVILLNLDLIQKPGIWPQHVVKKQVRFDKIAATFCEVTIFSGDTVITTVPVIDVN